MARKCSSPSSFLGKVSCWRWWKATTRCARFDKASSAASTGAISRRSPHTRLVSPSHRWPPQLLLMPTKVSWRCELWSWQETAHIIPNIQIWMITSMLRIIQKWVIQNIQFQMIYKHAQNHPKVDHTNHPNLDDFIHFSVLYRQQQTYIIQIWMIYHIIDKSSTFGWFVWITNHPFLEAEPTSRQSTRDIPEQVLDGINYVLMNVLLKLGFVWTLSTICQATRVWNPYVPKSNAVTKSEQVQEFEPVFS